MATKTQTPETSSTADREIVISRVLNAPRELVIKAWSDPMHWVRWWGPNGFTNSIQEMEIRKGGHIKYIMHGPDGTEYPNYIAFKEVELPDRISWDHGTFAGSPASFQTEVTFEALGPQTKVTLKSVFASKEMVEKVKSFAVEGGNQHLERLEKSVTRKPKEFVISRTFDAPLDLVWTVNSESRHLKHWWGPKGFSCEIPRMAFVPGGMMHYCLRNEHGFEMWGRFAYRRIVPKESITAIVSFSDPQGGITRHPGSPNWPLEMLSITTFEEKDGRTTETVTWSPVNASEEEIKEFEAGFAGMNQGFEGTFQAQIEYVAALKAGKAPAEPDRLEIREGLPGGQLSDMTRAGWSESFAKMAESFQPGDARLQPDWEVRLSRDFDAPKALVYDVFTKAEHLAHWWGPKGFTLPICENDFRKGGSFTWVMRAPDGSDHPMRGVYLDIVPGESFRWVCRLDDLLPEKHEIAAQFTFTEQGGRTTVSVHQTYAGVDAALKDDAKAGWESSLDRIDAYLAGRKGA